MDYLLFYPFIDESTTDPQSFTNTSTLPRYTDGAGVQVMAISINGRTGGQSFFFTYTNQDGVTGRISKTVVQNAATTSGTIVTSASATSGSSNPFIGLQDGDTGVRSIESITMLGVDVGVFTLVLVRPLATTQLRGVDAAVEKDYLIDSAGLPRIYDDAYLNFVVLPANAGIANALFMGDIKVIWN